MTGPQSKLKALFAFVPVVFLLVPGLQNGRAYWHLNWPRQPAGRGWSVRLP